MNSSQERRICSLCGREYNNCPSLSRTDNKTLICPDCGTREALSSIGMPVPEQNKVIQTIKSQLHME